MSSMSLKTMPSDAKYSAIDHGGLELADQPDRDATAPEIVPGSHPPLERKNSANQPEPVPQTDAANAPEYDESTKPRFMESLDSKEKAIPYAEAAEAPQPKPRRYCGMSRTVFVLVIVAGIVIILGAVLGGVLGTVLTKNNKSSQSTPPAAAPSNSSSANSTSSPTPLVARQNTGLAATLAAEHSDTLLTYYQDPSGRIIENMYSNGQWSLDNQSAINSSVVTDQADPGSPLAALSYIVKGTPHRNVFFLDSTGTLMATNTSTFSSNGIATSWSNPKPLSTYTALASSVGIAACSGNDSAGLNGIRLYLPLSDGGIQEVGYDFNNASQGWMDWEYWSSEQADAGSGVSCNTYDKDDNKLLNLYFRNGTTGYLQQSWFDYAHPSEGWYDGASADSNPVAPGSDVAACSDEVDTEYIFYQSPGGMVTRAVIRPTSGGFSEFRDQADAANGTKLAASYFSEAALYLFQNDTSESTMWLSADSRSGQSIIDTVIS